MSKFLFSVSIIILPGVKHARDPHAPVYFLVQIPKSYSGNIFGMDLFISILLFAANYSFRG